MSRAPTIRASTLAPRSSDPPRRPASPEQLWDPVRGPAGEGEVGSHRVLASLVLATGGSGYLLKGYVHPMLIVPIPGGHHPLGFTLWTLRGVQEEQTPFSERRRASLGAGPIRKGEPVGALVSAVVAVDHLTLRPDAFTVAISPTGPHRVSPEATSSTHPYRASTATWEKENGASGPQGTKRPLEVAAPGLRRFTERRGSRDETGSAQRSIGDREPPTPEDVYAFVADVRANDRGGQHGLALGVL